MKLAGHTWVIASRELRGLLHTPLAWATLSLVGALLAWLFLLQLDQYQAYRSQLLNLSNPPGVTQLLVTPFFNSAGMILMLVLPMLTMRSFAEQRRDHTLTLLMTAPISLTSIVLGKFFGICGFVALLLALLLAMPLSLLIATPLDVGLLSSATIGITLLAASFTAVGLWTSSLTGHPAVAATTGLGLLLLLWFLSAAGKNSQGGYAADALLPLLSTRYHFTELLSGWVSSADIAYFIILIMLMLGLTVLRLHSQRYQRH